MDAWTADMEVSSLDFFHGITGREICPIGLTFKHPITFYLSLWANGCYWL